MKYMGKNCVFGHRYLVYL